MAKRQRINIAQVGEHWMRVRVDSGEVTHDRVLPAGIPLVELHPEYVKKIGPYIIWSIDEPSAEERRCAFETGVMILVEITDGDLIGGVNRQAAEYASNHALEWWPEIREPVRLVIMEIIRNSFEGKAPFSEVISRIQRAGAFSEERAKLIGATEISQAQVSANLEAWKKTGLVSKVKWLAVGHDPCPMCQVNDGEIRSIGAKFPSGHEIPLAHPSCSCILQAVPGK